MIAKLSAMGVNVSLTGRDMLYWTAIVLCVVGLVWSVWQSKRETESAG